MQGIASKLAAVMGEIDYIPKTGKNTAQNYAYATDAEISDKVRTAMTKHGVVMIPRVTSHSIREITTQKGNTLTINTVEMEFTFIDKDSGESVVAATVGEGMDSGDKGCYKAMTGATKYALLKSFQIPTGDDPEKDDSPERGPERSTAPQQTRQTAAPTAQPQPQASGYTRSPDAMSKPTYNLMMKQMEKKGIIGPYIDPKTPEGKKRMETARGFIHTHLGKSSGLTEAEGLQIIDILAAFDDMTPETMFGGTEVEA